jgi:nicotinamidase-related amidase
MTTLTGRDKSALLVIDVQNGVVEGAYNLPAVLENINTTIYKARAAGVPVVWVQHSDEELVLDSERWQIVPELTPAEGESKVRKIYRSSFEATDLEEILAGLGVGHIYVTGMQTDNCVRHTTHAAQERGYDITVLADAHSTTGYEWDGHVVDAKAVVDQFNDNFYGSQLPGRFTRAVLTADLTFG